ncbi:MAG TPA: hypothetical protein VIC84_23090 [Blastocatellia bacterium]|jgi:hypothetical protein
MRSVDQTSRALRALAKALVDNETRTTQRERESLTEAVFRTVMESERKPETASNGHNERGINANTLRDRR